MSDSTRSKAQIEADIAAARARLAANVEGLISEAHPKAVAQRRVDDVKTFAATEYDNAKAQFKNENGWRLDRVAIVAGAVVGTMIFVSVVRKIVGKGK